MSHFCRILNRSFSSSKVLQKVTAAAAARIAITPKVPEPEPENNTELLSSKCCGLNFIMDGEDPTLKPDNEYPDWLWNIHIGKPKTYKDMDPNTREYWYALEKAQQEMDAKSRAGKGYYVPPHKNKLTYISRLPPKQAKSS